MRTDYKRYSYYKNGKRIFEQEHRHIMEEYLGRKLNEDEVVHHINQDKKDNRIENLQVMDKKEHARFHNLNRVVSDETRKKLSKSLKYRPTWNRQKSKEDIINIAKKYKELKKYRKVDKFFGYANGTTGSIIRGEIFNEYQDIIKDILNS